MIEIRMNDLSFSDHEISVFFNQLAQVDLNKEEISKLKTRTEGWVIALRLFSLINEDPVEKIKRLELVGEGQHTLSEYLLEEVLSNQPRHIQNLLMESSILNSFCEPLLQEILSNENKDTFNTNSLSLVDSLMKLNLFVIPLDDNQYWFRYHHMFQDFLQTQLKKNRNENEIIDLYKRATHWFEMRKLITEAIEYVSHVNDTDKIVRLITENWEEILDKDDWTTVENWFTFLPTELVDQNPNLLLAQLWIAQRSHQLALVPGLIEKVEKIGSELSDTETGYLSFAKCMLSYFIGDVKGSLDAANKALQLIPAKYKCFRADAYSFWTFSMLMNGKEEMALHQFELNYQNIQPPGEPIQTSRTLMHPSFIAIAKANLPLLIKYNKLFFNIEGNSPYMLGWGNYIKSMISWWSNEPQQCKEDLERFLYFKYQSASSSVMDGYVCLALTCEKLGLSNSADKALVEGSEYAKTINDHSALETLDSGRSHLNLMRNNLEDAIDWLEGSEFLPLNPTMLFWVEIPSITQCRVLIARGETKDLEKGVMLLNEYLVYSESVNNVLRMIDILVLQAVGVYISGKTRLPHAKKRKDC